MKSEDALLAELTALFATRRRDVRIGIGDDAALLKVDRDIVITTDVLVEHEDFLPGAEPSSLGRRVLAVNLSDLAAMGATPLHALLSLGLPKRTDPSWLSAFFRGVKETANEYGVAIVGGDLSASRVLFASITAIGRPSKKGVLTRRGAKPGDSLFVSGTLGAAAAGLELLLSGYKLTPENGLRAPGGRRVPETRSHEIKRLIRHQIDPRPMVELGRALADARLASAAIDLSDGLGRDLHRLCRASGVGATLDAASLPIDSALPALADLLDTDAERTALYGGEDFGLLFSVPSRKIPAVQRLANRFALRRIGSIDGSGRVLIRGPRGVRPLLDAGFDHFEKTPVTTA